MATTGIVRVVSDSLLGPVFAGVSAAETIAIVADPELSNLPFASLPRPDNGLPWGAGTEIVSAPTLRFALSAPRRAGRGIRILALGAPNDPRFPALPLSRVEVQGILAAYGGGKGFLGSDANLLALESALPDVTALHLSTHARLNPHRPEASAIMLAGGRDLDAAAIARLPLKRLELVTLAACESGKTSLAAGIGAFDFVGAFLKAGVSQVLASRTALPDDSRLFLEFHRLTSRGATPRVALQVLRRTSPEARWFLTLHTTISNPGGPA